MAEAKFRKFITNIYVDIETGEIINKKKTKNEYAIINTKKSATKIINALIINIKYEHICKKKPETQTRLPI